MIGGAFRMKIRSVLQFLVAAVGLASILEAPRASAGTAFTYQGRLQEAGAPANGRYDLRFELFGFEAGGTGNGAPIINSAVAVSNGLFTTTLDFGTSVFSGAPSWLEIAVRPAGGQPDFTILAPRQLLTPTPFAIYTLKAESLNGPLPDSQLSSNIARLNGDQTFSGSVTFSGNVAVGSSASAANLDVQGSVRAASMRGD